MADQDDAVARLFDAEATSEIVEVALRRAVLARRHALVRLVAAWLELAEQTGLQPTHAEVAELAGVSPSAARKGMSRFREFLVEARAAGR